MDEWKRHSRHVTRTRRWKVLRHQILERDGWACAECGKRGRLEVHHVKPVRTHPELSFAPGNLKSLCPSCHTRHTRRECGIPDPDPARVAWRQAVSEMETPTEQKEIPCSLP
ncbi:endonuclease [Rhodovulum sulfidophilum]|uniref:Putative HNH nuclease YajD n=1 Tax=Rhodovulum visakhapatnamense TaxID=364297 RepID=A0ABS1RJ95_9RHOB|nr:HNH endonuclease signature motif containing protein [Rhodovulum visakhapatnamense]MBL3568868.1 HNH endonuclease [Rhodovulum visakhapatnamense]MBL3579224.1 HNH endonuclease [Rhodovulum visakhapatnamense]OLS44482.1 endonuclease [Rhodovulum sulfidophilum]